MKERTEGNEESEESEESEAEHSSNTQESREMIAQREWLLCAGGTDRCSACNELTQALEDSAAE